MHFFLYKSYLCIHLEDRGSLGNLPCNSNYIEGPLWHSCNKNSGHTKCLLSCELGHMYKPSSRTCVSLPKPSSPVPLFLVVRGAMMIHLHKTSNELSSKQPLLMLPYGYGILKLPHFSWQPSFVNETCVALVRRNLEAMYTITLFSCLLSVIFLMYLCNFVC